MKVPKSSAVEVIDNRMFQRSNAQKSKEVLRLLIKADRRSDRQLKVWQHSGSLREAGSRWRLAALQPMLRDRYRQVLVLYLDRPQRDLPAGTGVCGRFGYSDLKEAALSGAADLWALYAGALLLEGWESLVRV